MWTVHFPRDQGKATSSFRKQRRTCDLQGVQVLLFRSGSNERLAGRHRDCAEHSGNRKRLNVTLNLEVRFLSLT